MSVAALADIHGNVHALEAVLRDPRFERAEEVVVLGDVVAGTFPAETLARIAALGESVHILRGNADRFVLEAVEGAAVCDQLGSDQLSSVRSWPLSFAIEVSGLGRVRCCHGTPRDDEEIITSVTPDAEIVAALSETDEVVVVGGHTHVQFDRRVDRWRFVNVGSVGRPYEHRPGAYWALLGPDVEFVRPD